jgi:hypothetical protein
LQVIANVHVCLEEARRRQVLPETSRRQLDTFQLGAPEVIVLGGIHIHRLLRPAMNAQVSLHIAHDPQPVHSDEAIHGPLVDSCLDKSTLPG